MKVLDPGHRYKLSHLDGNKTTILQFVNRGHNNDKEGTTNQEVLRALIDRVKFLEQELPWHGNNEIIYHLRMALVLHEARALERKVLKGRPAENAKVNEHDLHFALRLD